MSDEAQTRRVVLDLCDDCLNGSGGECHTPGCALWMNRAPDIPIYRWRYASYENVPPGSVWTCPRLLPSGRVCGYVQRGPGVCPYDHDGHDVALVPDETHAPRVFTRDRPLGSTRGVPDER